jgi:murein DD-endopeptidase MepM/ murein hydrolase activator NlpD
MGDGSFGSSRGLDGDGNPRLHRGEDYVCTEGTLILSTVDGKVSKIGYPYSNGIYRYVEVIDENEFCHRFFYVDGAVPPGAEVKEGDVIGTAQAITARVGSNGKTYGSQGMKNHIHYEIKKDGEFYDPEAYLLEGVERTL